MSFLPGRVLCWMSMCVLTACASAQATANSFLAHQAETTRGIKSRPLHSVAVAATIGSGGVGVDVATPLSSHLNLRAGFQTFDNALEIKSNGITANGDFTLGSVAASIDYFPFHNGFHLSPGISLRNDNHVAGPVFVTPGSTFSLGDVDYTSDPKDPIRGFARARFGGSVAPRFTVGWGNLLPRNGRRFSVPVELGFQYTSQPTLSLALVGSGCNNQGCMPINEGDGAQNIQREITKLQNDLTPLRFFPIISVGFGLRFGSTGK